MTEKEQRFNDGVQYYIANMKNLREEISKVFSLIDISEPDIAGQLPKNINMDIQEIIVSKDKKYKGMHLEIDKETIVKCVSNITPYLKKFLTDNLSKHIESIDKETGKITYTREFLENMYTATDQLFEDQIRNIFSNDKNASDRFKGKTKLMETVIAKRQQIVSIVEDYIRSSNKTDEWFSLITSKACFDIDTGKTSPSGKKLKVFDYFYAVLGYVDILKQRYPEEYANMSAQTKAILDKNASEDNQFFTTYIRQMGLASTDIQDLIDQVMEVVPLNTQVTHLSKLITECKEISNLDNEDEPTLI